MRISMCPCHGVRLAPAEAVGGARRSSSGGPVAPELRLDIAIGSRICAAQDVFDAYGHLSVRHPAAPERFVMTRSMPPALATANDLVELDLESDPCEGTDRPLFLERFIHGEIYKQRPDVNAIVHSHSLSVVPFTVVEEPMQAIFHTAAHVAAGAPIFDIADEFGDTDMLISDRAKGAALARTLADKSVCLMRGHGSVVVGPSLQHAVMRAVYTEVNARLQLHARLIGGGRVKPLSPREGALADAVNIAGVGRPWELWKSQTLREMKEQGALA
jgi:HCOMODA/2-hydroxy-3-carboxy-muconic semialdehyde decarboxylase